MQLQRHTVIKPTKTQTGKTPGIAANLRKPFEDQHNLLTYNVLKSKNIRKGKQLQTS